MKRRILASAAVVGLIAAACSRDDEHPPPPTWDTAEEASATPTDAVETSTPDDAATTSAEPTPDIEPTAEAADEPTETEEMGSFTLPDPTRVAPEDLPTEPPPEAAEDSQAGVSAFARYYIDVWNRAALTGDTTEMRELSTDDCDFCGDIMSGIENLATDGITTDDTSMMVTSVATGIDGDGSYMTTVAFVDGGYSLVENDGTVVLELKDDTDLAVQMVIVESPHGGKQVDDMWRANL